MGWRNIPITYFIKNCKGDSDMGYFIEANIQYPK